MYQKPGEKDYYATFILKHCELSGTGGINIKTIMYVLNEGILGGEPFSTCWFIDTLYYTSHSLKVPFITTRSPTRHRSGIKLYKLSDLTGGTRSPPAGVTERWSAGGIRHQTLIKHSLHTEGGLALRS